MCGEYVRDREETCAPSALLSKISLGLQSGISPSQHCPEFSPPPLTRVAKKAASAKKSQIITFISRYKLAQSINMTSYFPGLTTATKTLIKLEKLLKTAVAYCWAISCHPREV